MNNLINIISQIQNLFSANPELSVVVNNGHVLIVNGSENPSKIFYVINRLEKNAGIFSYYFTALSHVIYACRRSWIPVIDMQNGYYSLYHEDGSQANIVNIWDKYFSQPGGVYLNETMSAANVIYARSVWAYPDPGELDFSRMTAGDPVFDTARAYSTYLPLNEVIASYCTKLINHLKLDFTNTIGISYRLTYDKLKPAQHFFQPSIEEIFREADRLLRNDEFKYIFLATEDQLAVDLFVQRYGAARVSFIERPRVKEMDSRELNQSNTPLPNSIIEGINFGRDDEKHKIACEYISEMEILAKCAGLIAGRTNGAMYAYLRNGGAYRHLTFPTNRYL